MPAAPVSVIPTLVMCLVGWRMYGRFRRQVGRQLLKPRRQKFSIAIYATLTLILGIVSLLYASHLTVFFGLLGGLAAGVSLGLYGVHLTRFESTPEARYYTPNPYMGVSVSLLLVARIAYRMFVLSSAGGLRPGQPQLLQSPLTMVFFGVVAGYFMCYSTGVLARSRAS